MTWNICADKTVLCGLCFPLDGLFVSFIIFLIISGLVFKVKFCILDVSLIGFALLVLNRAVKRLNI